jgi:hypothetical protein
MQRASFDTPCRKTYTPVYSDRKGGPIAMKNPVRAFIEDNRISTSELARRADMRQPTVYRHVYNDQYLSFDSMEAYASVGISWNDLRAWNKHLQSHKKQDQQGGSNVSSRDGGTPPGGEDI